MTKNNLLSYFESTAGKRQFWKKRNSTYHKLLGKNFSFIIPENSKVLELGCSTGDLLAAVKPNYGVGVDFSSSLIEIAKNTYPNLTFICQDVEELTLDEKFDYIIISDLVGSLWDVQKMFDNLQSVSHERTRVIVSYYNYMWEPILKISEKLGLKSKQPLQNWLTSKDISRMLELSGFETIRIDKKTLLPKNIPLISTFVNNFIANLPIFREFTLSNFIISRPIVETQKEYSVSIIVPARNERGNIENAILTTPYFGSNQEFIFVEGHSQDNTYEEMLRVQKAYPEKDIKVIKQSGKGKGNAVRDGIELATGEILYILDADLTTPPQDMPKFYEILRKNKGEFINGCRLVYPMEKEAMRFLNLIANKFFGIAFSFLLGQRLRDTLCGTKVLFKKDYEIIKQNRHYFGDFDPFGDFDLLFGAAKLNLKIVEVNVRYKDRQYGTTQISRFKHGILLIRMTLFASKKLKFF